MCSHYEASTSQQLLDAFCIALEVPTQTDLWPGYLGPLIRQPLGIDPDDEAAPEFEVLSGMFGLLPFWAKYTKLARNTYNARSETVATKPSFRAAWREAQYCIIPVVAWRSGKAVPTNVEQQPGLLSIDLDADSSCDGPPHHAL